MPQHFSTVPFTCSFIYSFSRLDFKCPLCIRHWPCIRNLETKQYKISFYRSNALVRCLVCPVFPSKFWTFLQRYRSLYPFWNHLEYSFLPQHRKRKFGCVEWAVILMSIRLFPTLIGRNGFSCSSAAPVLFGLTSVPPELTTALLVAYLLLRLRFNCHNSNTTHNCRGPSPH